MTGQSYQQQFVEADGDKYLQAGRQAGKTKVLADDAWDTAAGGSDYLVVAPSLEMAHTVMDAVFEGLNDRLEALITVNKKTKVELTTGGSIDVISAASVGTDDVVDLLRDVDRVGFEEAAYIEEDVFQNIRRRANNKNIPISAVTTLHPDESHPVEALRPQVSASVFWATIWDNPKSNVDGVEAFREDMDPERELAELYGVRPPAHENE